jgi:hypothetical protein
MKIVFLGLLVGLCVMDPARAAAQTPTVPATTATTAPAATTTTAAAQNPRKPYQGFPDFGHMVTAGEYQTLKAQAAQKSQYLPPPFRLAQDFPKSKPTAVPEFFKIDFKDGTKWLDYINKARDFCFEGNIFGGNVEEDFVPQKNTKRAWNHLPWMHWGDQGSEGFHGLIKEAPISPQQLTAAQTGQYQVYAVAFYNDFASYTLGRIWKNPEDPDPTVTDSRFGKENGFPVGTVIFKLLYTDAPSNEVDYLQNPVEWTAYITTSWTETVQRTVTTVRLIQMDMMIRDDRALSTGGWVFLTFCYNGALKKTNPWENLVPVGLMWGNDPSYTKNIIAAYPPAKTTINPDLKESRINPSPDLPPQHLGWGMRLDGPVDLNTSSCMSCHSTAGFPQTASLVPPNFFLPQPPTSSKEWLNYFRNVPCATPFSPNMMSCDFSLMVSISLGNFAEYKTAQWGGFFDEEFGAPAKRPNRAGVSPREQPPKPPKSQ